MALSASLKGVDRAASRSAAVCPFAVSIDMPFELALARAAAHVDDAVEYLTFERFDWAFDEAWRGVAWLLTARAEAEAPAGLPPKGTWAAPGSLRALVDAGAADAALVSLVEALESLAASCGDGDPSAALLERSGEVSALVFGASATLDAIAAQHGLAEPAIGYGGRAATTDRWDSEPVSAASGLDRRGALKLLAASSMLTFAACARPEPVSSQQRAAVETAPTPEVPSARILAVTPLEGLNWPVTDPFLFCAHHLDEYPAGNDLMGPAASLEGRALGRDFEGRDNWRMYHGEQIPGFPRHPHRGFETVTVVRTGMLDHADSMGATARYGGGDVQWLTAGGGIQHAEMFPLLRADSGNPLELFQIWLNLPARDKMVPSYFTMLWNEQIPRVEVRDAAGRLTELTVVAGAFGEVRPPSPPPNSWASRDESDLAIWKIRMAPQAQFEFPAVVEGTERSLYVHVGSGIRAAGEWVDNLTRVELDGRGPFAIEAGDADVEILLLQARPIGEPVARRGPFVMNTQDEIRQAYTDYQQTGFGGWPWPDDAPVHDRSRGRFARMPDGTLDEPV